MQIHLLYVTLTIKILCMNLHSMGIHGVYLNEDILRYSIDVRSALKEIVNLDSVTFDAISLKWNYLV